jgi:hypothetical protein
MIEKYVIVSGEGRPDTDELFDSAEEARDFIREHHAGEDVAIVAYQFEFTDSDLVEVWRKGQVDTEAVSFP